MIEKSDPLFQKVVERLYNLHDEYWHEDGTLWCTVCNVPMPCQTIKELNEMKQDFYDPNTHQSFEE